MMRSWIVLSIFLFYSTIFGQDNQLHVPIADQVLKSWSTSEKKLLHILSKKITFTVNEGETYQQIISRLEKQINTSIKVQQFDEIKNKIFNKKVYDNQEIQTIILGISESVYDKKLECSFSENKIVIDHEKTIVKIYDIQYLYHNLKVDTDDIFEAINIYFNNLEIDSPLESGSIRITKGKVLANCNRYTHLVLENFLYHLSNRGKTRIWNIEKTIQTSETMESEKKFLTLVDLKNICDFHEQRDIDLETHSETIDFSTPDVIENGSRIYHYYEMIIGLLFHDEEEESETYILGNSILLIVEKHQLEELKVILNSLKKMESQERHLTEIANSTRFNINFPGGTIEEFYRHLEKSYNDKLNDSQKQSLTWRKAFGKKSMLILPEINKKEITLNDLREFLLQVTEGQLYINLRIERDDLGTSKIHQEGQPEIRYHGHLIVSVHTHSSETHYRSYVLSKKTDKSNDIILDLDDCITALYTAWHIKGLSANAKLRFHENTNMLIIIGDKSAVDIADVIMGSLLGIKRKESNTPKVELQIKGPMALKNTVE